VVQLIKNRQGTLERLGYLPQADLSVSICSPLVCGQKTEILRPVRRDASRNNSREAGALARDGCIIDVLFLRKEEAG
jgi:hypothetical protein